MDTNDILSKLPLKPLWTTFICFEQPLIGTNYLDIVSKEYVVHNTMYESNIEIGSMKPDPYYAPRTTYQCAEECAVQFLSELHNDEPKHFDSIVRCYENAYNDGIYEAGNNLGVIYSEIGDSPKALYFLEDAAKKGCVLAMWNCFSLLWSRDKMKACDWLVEVSKMERPSLNCLFNYAVLLHHGANIEDNTIVCNDQKAYNLLEFIRNFKQPNEDETDTVCNIVERLFQK